MIKSNANISCEKQNGPASLEFGFGGSPPQCHALLSGEERIIEVVTTLTIPNHLSVMDNMKVKLTKLEIYCNLGNFRVKKYSCIKCSC